MEEYMSGKKASEVLEVYYRTLYQWDKKKLIETIRTPGGKRLYNVKKYLSEHNKNITNVKKVNITKELYLKYIFLCKKNPNRII